jgi:hypothetical protein
VEQLLQETNLTVCVFTGQLDLIVDTPGELCLTFIGHTLQYFNSWPSVEYFFSVLVPLLVSPNLIACSVVPGNLKPPIQSDKSSVRITEFQKRLF